VASPWRGCGAGRFDNRGLFTWHRSYVNNPSPGQQFSQRVFRGDHSDIGGGQKAGQNVLALAPLQYIWSKGKEAGVPFGPLKLVGGQEELTLEVDGRRRPWSYQFDAVPHDYTTVFFYTDGGLRKNLPGGR